MHGDREFFVYVWFEKGSFYKIRRSFWGLIDSYDTLDEAHATEREAYLNDRRSRTVYFRGGAPNGRPPVELSKKEMKALPNHEDGYKTAVVE